LATNAWATFTGFRRSAPHFGEHCTAHTAAWLKAKGALYRSRRRLFRYSAGRAYVVS